MDADIESAFRQREQLVKACEGHIYAQELDEERRARHLLLAHRLRSARIFVWEPAAYEAFERFWSLAANRRVFNELCLDSNGEVRFLPKLVDESFHYFPAGGLLFPDVVPAAFRDPDCDAVFPPTTNAIVIGHLDSEGLHAVPILLNTPFLDPAKLPVDLDERMRVLTLMLNLPPRDMPFQPWVSINYRVQTLVVCQGDFVEGKGREWLLPLYRMRIFLEQPLVGFRPTRAHKAKSRKMGVPRDEEFTKVYMREELGKKIPRFFLSKFSRVTGRKLEFEVAVRGHLRHCPSGKIVQVRSYKRGKLGVFREKVVKVIR